MGRFAPMLAVLAAGCTVGPDFVPPVAALAPSWLVGRPASTARSQPTAAPLDPAWWSAFGDPLLTSLAGRVVADNLDVRTAGLRLAESRAQRGVTAAQAFPQVNGNGSYTREKQSAKGVSSILGGSGGGGGGGGSGGSQSGATGSNGLGGRQSGIPLGGGGGSASQPFDLFQYGFDASWELDIWGRVRRQAESADAAVDAAADGLRDTLLSMTAELARDYLQLRGTQDSLRITAANLATARETVRLTRQRAQGGLATDLDVANAEAQAAETEAGLAPLEQQQAALVNAAGALLGEPPGALGATLLPPRPVPPVPPRVPVGLPSELARRRPDIRRAEAQLHAATADIGAAQADFYPRVTLSGSVALQALQFKDTGSLASRTYGLGPSVSVPLFDGGRLRGTLELRRAQQREAAVVFQRTVLQAWREVDDAMTAYDAEQRRRDLLAAQAASARRALGLARARYGSGVSDFLEVLTAQRTLLAAEGSLASSGATAATNLVALYKALGGGWEAALPDGQAPAPAPDAPASIAIAQRERTR